MKKIIIFIVMIMMAFNHIGVQATSSYEDIKVERVYYDQVTLDDERNLYHFTLDHSAVITFALAIAFDQSDFLVYDENMQVIFESKNNRFNYTAYRQYWFMEEGEPYYNEYFKLALSKGSYYIAIQVGEAKADAGDYQFEIIYNTTIYDDEIDLNNKIVDATLIDANNCTLEGYVGYDDYIDYYRFDLIDQYQVSLDGKLVVDGMGLKIYDEQMQVIYEKYNSSYQYGDESCYFRDTLLLDKGTYYFEIKSGKVNEGGMYSFNFVKSLPFKDVYRSYWYYNCISEVYDLQLMTGLNETYFSPNASMTRGMVAMVLYRMSNSDDVAYQPLFKDVKANLWYSSAITWASNNGIVKGYGNGLFGVDDNITREQMATMCYRYYEWKTHGKMKGNVDLTKFKDNQHISKNMIPVMKWAVGIHLLDGSDDGYLYPRNHATRAECAKMLLQLYKLTNN